MADQPNQVQAEPQEPQQANSMGFATLLLKILAALGGGGVGSLILVVIFFLASSLLTPLTTPDEGYVSPIFVFVLLIMIFLSSTISNIVSTWLLALTERGKYSRVSSTLYQVFIINLIIFLLMVPIYFLTSSIDVGITAYAIALHIILTAQVSAIIMEIVSNYRYALVGVYGVTISILVSSGVMLGFAAYIKSPQILLFLALPIVWGSIAFVGSIVTMIYGWVANTYDKDFLSTQTMYGDDYGKDVLPEEEEAPKAQDEAGADFLRHN